MVLGCSVDVPTFDDGMVSVKIPAGSRPNTKLRLKAKGIAVGNAIGDLIVNLQMDMPKNITDSYKSALLELNKFEQQDITPQRQLWNKKLGEYRE